MARVSHIDDFVNKTALWSEQANHSTCCWIFVKCVFDLWQRSFPRALV